MPDGSRKRISFYGKTRTEAARKQAEAIASENGGSPLLDFDPHKLTVAEYLDEWLRSVRSSISERTYRRYEQTVRCHLSPLLGGAILSKLTPGHVEGCKNAMLRKDLSPGTVDKNLSVLSQALNRAVAWELVSRNPVKAISRPKTQGPGRARSLSEAEAAALVASVARTRTEALYHVACKLGLRQGELLALKWPDIDLEAGRMTVERSVDTNVTPARFGPTKTGEGRTIKLPQSVVTVLRAHHKLQLEERVAAPAWQDHGLVFPKPNGRVGVHSRLSFQLDKDLRAAGLPDIHFHVLRHTAATLMIRSGMPIRVVADVLGHRDPAVTLRRYAHVLDDMQQSAADMMDGYAF